MADKKTPSSFPEEPHVEKDLEAEPNLSIDDLVDEDDDAETRELMAAKQKAARDALARQKTAAAAGKARSNLTLDVKPISSEVDMEKLTTKVRAIKMEGLKWLGSSLIDIAYGIKKLRIMCQLTDELISPDAIREEIEKLEDDVQSTDVFAFQMA